MTIQEAIVAFLLSDAGVSALVQKKIYPEQAVQSAGQSTVAYGVVITPPYITYQMVSFGTQKGLAGPTSYAYPRFQIDCWGYQGTGYGDAWTLSAAVEAAVGTSTTASPTIPASAAFNGFVGTMGGIPMMIDEINITDESEPPVKGESNPTRRVSMDFAIRHIRS